METRPQRARFHRPCGRPALDRGMVRKIVIYNTYDERSRPKSKPAWRPRMRVTTGSSVDTLMRMLRDDLVQRARSEDMRVPRQWAYRITDIDTRSHCVSRCAEFSKPAPVLPTATAPPPATLRFSRSRCRKCPTRDGRMTYFGRRGKTKTLTKRSLQYQVFQDWLGGFGLRSLRIACDGSLFILDYAIGMVINPRSIPHAIVCYNGKVAQPALGFVRRRGARPRSLHPARPGAREAVVVSSWPFQ